MMILSRKLMTGVMLFSLLAFITATLSVVTTEKAAAACSPLPTDRGTVTATVSTQTAGNYRVWSRIKTADVSKNSYLLQIDDSVCGVIVGDASLTANTWTWVDYQSGSTSNKITASNLSAGNHTVVMAGREDGVMVDRVILTMDTSCVPTGTGENCANPPDTTAPVVSITAPANNAVISTVTSVTATASDNIGVTKVEFYVDGSLKATDTTSSYAFSLDPASYSIGSHQLTAKAYDAAGNSVTSGAITITVPDSVKPTVSVTSPTANASVSGTIAMAATATDNIGVTKVDFYVDNVYKATSTTSPYSASLNTTTLSNATHQITARAYDAANNITTSAAVTVTVNNVAVPPADTTPPVIAVSAPSNNTTVSGSITIAATATDASGIQDVKFYVDDTVKNVDNAAAYSYIFDTTTVANGTHTIKAVATDASTNKNVATSSIITITVSNTGYIAEDINQDSKVNLLDFSILSANFGKQGAAIANKRADINGDNIVNLLDFSRLVSKFGN